jgi:hypothetical protein
MVVLHRVTHMLLMCGVQRLLEDKHEYRAAEPLFRQAMEIDIKALGEDHPEVATDMNNLGVCSPSPFGTPHSMSPLATPCFCSLCQAVETDIEALSEDKCKVFSSAESLPASTHGMA